MNTTLGNPRWLRDNETKIKDMFPKTWTHMDNLNIVSMGFKLKLLGVDWRSKDQLLKSILFLERTGFLIRQNKYQVRANPGRVME